MPTTNQTLIRFATLIRLYNMKSQKSSKERSKKMKTIKFKKAMSSGNMVEASGIPYTTKNGIKCAIHKERGGYAVTELTTGQLIVRERHNTIASAKAEAEKNSPLVAKIMGSDKKKKEKPAPKAKAKSAAKSKPAAKCKSAAIKPTAPKITSKPTVKSKHAVTKPAAKKRTTFTVMDGQRGKTFATMKEAQAYEADMRARTGVFCEIRKGNKKISHRVVSFTARNK